MLSEGETVGFEAWVEGRDDKIRLNEYQIQHHPAEDGEPAYTECFLETIDKPFRIMIKKLLSKHIKTDTQSIAYIDGNRLGQSVWHCGNEMRSYDKAYVVQSGKSHKVALVFAALDTTDNVDEVTISQSELKTLGTIKITLKSGAFYGKRRSYHETTEFVVGKADEKSKKFCMSVGATEPVEQTDLSCNSYSFEPHKGKKLRRHNFIFKYRPRIALVQRRIIDEPEEQTPLPESRPPKRKRASTVIDLVDSDVEGEISAVKEEEEEEEDIKPSTTAKRVRYLEDQLKKLASENKRLRQGGSRDEDTIDLTLDDD
ncbi:uncharacterized protein L201_002821 [Kwoniella dendrophila CBS 6074]|uniref:DUF7918 domain-containing protein n=1 Tax=Kwoniella dendrophila CBS 6074 TaxID=1295534 RepID=A0AAX4JS15_9TREE